jgi:hypothetical protein
LNVDINHIEEQPMTQSLTARFSAFALAAVFVLASWLPTVSVSLV